MIHRGMNAAGRHQPHQMAGFAVFLQIGDQLFQNRIFFNATVFDCLVDSGQVLHDDASGTQIHVTDFRVAHLSFRQTNRQPVGFDQAVRIFFQIAVPVWRMAVFNGVVGGNRLTIAPAVQNQ